MGALLSVGKILGALAGIGSFIGIVYKVSMWWRGRSGRPPTDHMDPVAGARHRAYPELLRTEQQILDGLDGWRFESGETAPGGVLELRGARPALDGRLSAYASDEVERLVRALQDATDSYLLAIQTHHSIRAVRADGWSSSPRGVGSASAVRRRMPRFEPCPRG